MHNFVPGPSGMSPAVRKAYAKDYGSPDVDPAFWEDYNTLSEGLLQICGADGTKDDVVISSGEGMVSLWGAMKSLLSKGDNVTCVVNGVFGAGFADMAETLGCNVTRMEFSWEHSVPTERLISTLSSLPPQKMTTMVHCETPSGVLNRLDGVGAAVHQNNPDGLFLVDFVSSCGAVPVAVRSKEIDVGLVAPQKVLSGPPALGFTVLRDAERVYSVMRKVGYQGYDAMLPFEGVRETQAVPYTHNWGAVAACRVAVQEYLEEGGGAVMARHESCSKLALHLAEESGLVQYPVNTEDSSPTVTALKLPQQIPWESMRSALHTEGVTLGGSYGPLAGKVFRVGHMGVQAHPTKVAVAMKAVGNVLKRLR